MSARIAGSDLATNEFGGDKRGEYQPVSGAAWPVNGLSRMSSAEIGAWETKAVRTPWGMYWSTQIVTT